jgi:hypothetical protein
MTEIVKEDNRRNQAMVGGAIFAAKLDEFAESLQ